MSDNCCLPRLISKNKSNLALLKDDLSTNPILSAFHLERPYSNIYVYFSLVNKQMTGISFLKWNRQWNEIDFKV